MEHKMFFFFLALPIGFVLLLIPLSKFKKWSEHKFFPILLRVTGIVLIVISTGFIYAVVSGKIVLPLK